MPKPLRIVHCDDAPDVLMLVEHWLEDHSDLELVASAPGLRAALAHVQAQQPDVAVTDTMSMTQGEEFLGWLRAAAPAAAIVLYTGYERHQLGLRIVQLVDRVVTKQIDEADLVATLRSLTV